MTDETDIDDPAWQYRMPLPEAPQRARGNFHPTWGAARDYLVNLGWSSALSSDVSHYVKGDRSARIKSRANGEYMIHYSMRKRR